MRKLSLVPIWIWFRFMYRSSIGNSVQQVGNLRSPRYIKSHLPMQLLPRKLTTVKPKVHEIDKFFYGNWPAAPSTLWFLRFLFIPCFIYIWRALTCYMHLYECVRTTDVRWMRARLTSLSNCADATTTCRQYMLHGIQRICVCHTTIIAYWCTDWLGRLKNFARCFSPITHRLDRCGRTS